MYASEVREIIEKFERTARREFDKTYQHVEGNRKNVLNMRQQEVALLRQMAAILLRESPNLEDVQAIKKLIDDLQSSLATMEKQQGKLQGEIEQALARQATLEETIQQAETQRSQQLRDDVSLARLVEKTEQARDAAEHARALNEEIKTEVGQKLLEYTQDRRFAYLVQTRFGEPEYKAWSIIRNLDSWLARQINFTRNRQNQKLLLSLLDESGMRLEATEQQLAALSREYDAQVARLEQALGLSAFYEEQKGLVARLSELRQKHSALSQELADGQVGQGNLFGETASQIAHVMKKMGNLQLEKLTQKTESPEDDLLLKKLTATQADIEKAESEIAEWQSENTRKETEYRYMRVLKEKFENRYHRVGDVEYAMSAKALMQLMERVREGQLSPAGMLDGLVPVERPQVQTNHGNTIQIGSALLTVASVLIDAAAQSKGSGSSSRSSGWGSSSGSSDWGSGSSSSSGSSGGSSSSGSSGRGSYTTTDSF